MNEAIFLVCGVWMKRLSQVLGSEGIYLLKIPPIIFFLIIIKKIFIGIKNVYYCINSLTLFPVPC